MKDHRALPVPSRLQRVLVAPDRHTGPATKRERDGAIRTLLGHTHLCCRRGRSHRGECRDGEEHHASHFEIHPHQGSTTANPGRRAVVKTDASTNPKAILNKGNAATTAILSRVIPDEGRHAPAFDGSARNSGDGVRG